MMYDKSYTIRVTGNELIKLLADMAVRLYNEMPEERSISVPAAKARSMRATAAVDTACEMLSDITARVNGQ